MKKIFTLKNIFLALLLTTSLTATAETGWTVEYDNGIAIFYSSWKGGMKVGGLTFRTGFDGYVNIPETVEINGITYNVVRIGENIANGSGKVHYVTLPETVNYICDNAFYNCRGLKEINIPAAVTYIGEGAFYYCNMLTSRIAIPEGQTEIGDYTFYYCESIPEISIPESVTTIGYMSFLGCKTLTELYIPSEVTTIGERAFQACGGLTSFTIPKNVTEIGECTFLGCKALTTLYSLNDTAPICADCFSFSTPEICTLYVPYGSYESYSTADVWCEFKTIIEIGSDTEGIASFSSDNAEITGYYTLDGKAATTPQKGINIVRYSDGSTKKMVVR